MPITATIDRFEGEIAVLILEPEQTVVKVSRADLPDEAGWGDVVRLEGWIDREETGRRRSDAKKQIERLKWRNNQY